MRKPSRTSGDVTEADRNAGEVAAYIADLCRELAAMARPHGFGVLAYLLDMAVEDAEKQGRSLRETPST